MSVVTARLAWSPRAGATCDDALRGDSFERGAIRAITLIQCIFTFLGLALALTYFDPSGSAELRFNTLDRRLSLSEPCARRRRQALYTNKRVSQRPASARC